MKEPERFNEAIETLLDDRSPAIQVRYLDPDEERMLVLAQRIRGSRRQAPSPDFLQELVHRLSPQHSYVRISRHS